MKLIKDHALKSGVRRVTVEIAPGEELIALHQRDHVKLGYPREDIVAAHVVLNLERVTWCSAQQEWVRWPRTA